MKNIYWKNKNNRYLYKSIEKKRLVLKKVHEELELNKKIRTKSFYYIKNINRRSSISSINNRCLLTNRGRSVYKKFKLSRLMFRDLALKGLLVGVKKSSW
uniref:Ribosomal protein S14 n=1 Tax=Cafileria marina TaxID=2557541 RepID=A0A5B9IKN8_9STRA|nr:ribosomal protein S14 [Cafileria marina]QEF30242.1 ribosomal protein S14 [Cafileria marina]